VFYAEQDKWEPAIAEFSKAVELKPEAMTLWYQRALTRLAAGRPEDCREMLQRFAQTDKADDAHWVAWTCALGPDATADWPKAIALAEKASQSDPKSFQFLNPLGAVLYRSGRFEDAAKKLKEAETLGQGSGGSPKSSPAYAWFFLAMAQERLQHREDARAAFDKAVAETDKGLREHKEGIADVPWNRRLTLKLLRDEAQTLLGISEAPTTEKEKTE
jgi:tetratricopeptide (TPR) repeat protein